MVNVAAVVPAQVALSQNGLQQITRIPRYQGNKLELVFWLSLAQQMLVGLIK